MKPRKPQKRVYRYRSAVSGRFVSKYRAELHPRTAVKERVKP